MPKKNGTIFNPYDQREEEDEEETRFPTEPASNNLSSNQYVRKKTPGRRINVIADNYSENIPAEIKSYMDRIKAEEKLQKLAQESNNVIFRCNTVFPFDFFPDTVIIDKRKVSLIIKIFYFSESVHSIPIKNIKDVTVDTNIFFASLTIVPDMYIGQATTVTHLHKNDAFKARRILQGLILCSRENVDISSFTSEEILRKIETAGTAIETHFAS